MWDEESDLLHAVAATTHKADTMAALDPIDRLDLYDEEVTFLFGGDAPVVSAEKMLTAHRHLWRRVYDDLGTHHDLTAAGAKLDPWDPAVKVPVQVVARYQGQRTMLDLVAQMCQSVRSGERYAADKRYEEHTGRWRKNPTRTAGFVPGDVGAVRARLLTPDLAEPVDYNEESPVVAGVRSLNMTGAGLAYLADPYFIPAGVADEVVTGRAPGPDARAELKLPAPYVMVFHDGIPMPRVAGAVGYGLLAEDALLVGGLLAANPDGSVHEDVGFLIVAMGRDGYFFDLIGVECGDQRAGQVLWQYAALLTWMGWKAPPKLPPDPGGGRKTQRAHLRKITGGALGGGGGYHGVHVMRHLPPAEPPARTTRSASGRALKYRQARPGHWTRRTRIGIRDDNDQLVGPVYKDGAVEGVTFTRGRVWVRPSVARRDLPERPGQTVHRVPSNITREQNRTEQ